MLGYVDAAHGGKGVASARSSSGAVLHNPDGSLSRQSGGRRGGQRGGPSLPVPLALTTIGYATADVTSHQGRGANVTQAGAHLFLITWEVSLSPIPPSFPLPFSFFFFLFLKFYFFPFFPHINNPGQAPSSSSPPGILTGKGQEVGAHSHAGSPGVPPAPFPVPSHSSPHSHAIVRTRKPTWAADSKPGGPLAPALY